MLNQLARSETIATFKKKQTMSSFQDIISTSKPVLVDFFATWCGPCQTLAPILSQVKAELGDAVSIIKIDVDKNRMLASQYNVAGVPTMMLFKDEKLLWRQSGVMSKDDLVRTIRQHS